MSVEAYLFFHRQKKMDTKKEAEKILALYLKLSQLNQMIYNNSQLQRLFPLLLSYHYSSLCSDLHSSVPIQSLNHRLFSPDSLLWITFHSGEDCLQDRTVNHIASVMTIFELLHYEEHQTALMAPFPFFFYDLTDLPLFFSYQLESQQSMELIRTVVQTANHEVLLYQHLSPTRSK